VKITLLYFWKIQRWPLYLFKGLNVVSFTNLMLLPLYQKYLSWLLSILYFLLLKSTALLGKSCSEIQGKCEEQPKLASLCEQM